MNKFEWKLLIYEPQGNIAHSVKCFESTLFVFISFENVYISLYLYTENLIQLEKVKD